MNSLPDLPNNAVLPGPQPGPKPLPPEVSDDANSQALSDALRSSFVIVKVVMVLLVLAFLSTGMVTVGPQEKAMILRFGKPVGEGDAALLGPGLHWAFPPPIDEVVKIPIGQVQTVRSTVGWYQTTAAMEAANSEPEPRNSLNPLADSYVLTADGNIIHVRGTLRYRISEPGLRFTFDFVETPDLIQDAFNNALVFVASQYKVDDVLTRDFTGFREKVGLRLNQLIQQQGLGVTIDQIDLQAIAPRWLKSHFNAVLESEVKRGKVINQARSEADKTVNQAKAQAAALVNAGERDRNRLVEMIAAEAKRFTGLLPAYHKDPQLFTRLHQNDTLQRVLTNATDKWVLPLHTSGSRSQIRLQISREPEKVGVIKPTIVEGH